MAIASLRVPMSPVPQVDNSSWLSDIAKSLGSGIDEFSQRRSFGKLADMLQQPGQAPAQHPAGGFLSSLAPQQATQAGQPTGAAPVAPVMRGQAQGSTYRPFIDTVRAGGLTNPNALAAVAAYGDAESGWSPKNAVSTWSDPSQSGQPGTSGGILSWRGDRYSRLAAGGDLSPEAQARYFLQEDPQLIAALNNAQSPEDASRLMANAWKFAGYDKPGGEAGRRSALARNYFANEYANQPASNGAAAAIEAQAPGGMGSPLTEQAFDDRFGPAPLPAEQVVGEEALAARLAESNAAGPAAQPAMATPQAEQQPAAYAPNQVADASGAFAGVPGVQPIQRGGVNPEIIQFMLRDPNLREMGLKLWAQNAQGPNNAEPWQFVQGADGTLLRANQRTGEIQPVAKFAKGANGLGADEAGLNLVYGQDENGNTVAFQPLKGGGLRQVELPNGVKLTPGVSNIDTGTGTLTINNKTGAPITQTPKNVSGAAQLKKEGENTAEAIANAPQAQASGEQMLATIDSLFDDPYLNSMIGAVDSRRPNISSSSARVQSKMDQIGGQAFLQAYNNLRGGGAITEAEGQKATQSLARLNTAQNETDYRAALSELRAIVVTGINRARRKAGLPELTLDRQGGAAKGSRNGNTTQTGVQWSVEE